MLTQKFIAILALAFTVSASPLVIRDHDFFSVGGDGEGNQEIGNGGQNTFNIVDNSGNIHGDFTVDQSAQSCGNAQLNCCNDLSRKGDTTNFGILASVFGSGDIGVQCSPINAAIVGAQIPINKACEAKAACCQNNGRVSQNGLINIGCIALAGLL